MPRRERHDLAAVLLAKAAGDEAALRELVPHEHVPDGILGFHAQQAVEKRLKAVLAARSVDYPFTHDIDDLARRVEENGVELPLERTALRELTPWAVVFRYEDALEDEPLDRAQVLDLVETVGEWAARAVEAA